MTTLMIFGFISIAASVALMIIYFIAHKNNDNSIAAKILMWFSMLFGVAGAAMLTIEYAFPDISHPHVMTLYEHYVEYYGDSYYTYIKAHTSHTVVDDFISVDHKQLKSINEENKTLTLYKTEVIYVVDNNIYTITFMNKYECNSDYTYQNVVSYEIQEAL